MPINTINSLESSIIFLGLAEEVNGNSNGFPIEPVNIIQLSQFKVHILYPHNGMYKWIFLVRHGFIKRFYNDIFKINIYNPDGEIFESIEVNGPLPLEQENTQEKYDYLVDDKIVIRNINTNVWKLMHCHIDAVIIKPGAYILKILYRDNEVYLGEVHFFYKKPPNFTPEQVRAIESDPYSTKSVLIILVCKHCPYKLQAYCALARDLTHEDGGYIWYKELPDTFLCECNKTSYTLQYFKEGLHGLLGIDIKKLAWSYERRYSHTKIEEIVRKFNAKLQKNQDEQSIQKRSKELVRAIDAGSKCPQEQF